MFSHGLIVEPRGAGRDPVAVALDSCRDLGRLPTLADLVEGIATGLSCLPGVVDVAVLVNIKMMDLQESGWSLQGAHCALMKPGENDARWVRVSPGWENKIWQVITDGEASDTFPVRGCGPLEGTEYSDPDGMPAVDCPWWLDRVVSQGSPLLSLLVVLDPTSISTENEACAVQLHRMADFMEPLLAVWSEASVLRTRLRQVTAEARALGRINQLQGRFVAMASHEFRTPLTSITAYTDVLLTKITGEQFPQALEFLGVIKQEADRLLRMINRILDFSRLEFGSQLLDLKLLDLEPLVRETLRSLGPGIQEKRQSITILVPRDLPRVEIDADLIRQVLVNLVGNAIKYTPQGGAITVRLSEEASTVAIAVCDNGPGIAPSDMKRIFNEFYRASGNEQGTGLGLSIARHIVNLHGGHITVAPRETGGTAFTFVLPKAARVLDQWPSYLTKYGDPADLKALVVNLTRLLAELTTSFKAVMILKDGHGSLLPVCALGLDPLAGDPEPWPETRLWTEALENENAIMRGKALRGLVRSLDWLAGSHHQDSPWMLMPVKRHGKTLGCVILGRRHRQDAYGQPDEDQARVLARVAGTALSNLDEGTKKIMTAIRALTVMRRRGVPTATASALLMARELGLAMKLPAKDIANIQYAAALHDAGMTRLNDDVLSEEGKLSWDQRDEVDRHVDHGLELMAPLISDQQVEAIIRHHHEWYDGSGYPDGLKGETIPPGARLLAVIDAWYSLITNRPYRQGLAEAAARSEIESHAGTQFDPEIMELLSHWLDTGPGQREIQQDNHQPSTQE